MLLLLSLWCLGVGSNELFASPGYFKADPVLTSQASKSQNFLLSANTAFSLYLRGIVVAPPTISNCDSTINKIADNGCQALVSWNVPNASGGNLAALYPQLASNPGVQLPGSSWIFNVGTDTVIYKWYNNTFTDSAFCKIPVNVFDFVAPQFTSGCNALVTANNTPDSCFAKAVALNAPMVMDLCSNPVKLSYSFFDANSNLKVDTISPGATIPATLKFAIGTTLVTFTAMDSAGNSTFCRDTVVITDNQFPVMAAAHNDTTVASSNLNCGKVLGFTTPGVTDNCSASVRWAIFREDGQNNGFLAAEDDSIFGGTGNISSFPFDVDTNYIVYTATDAFGNQVTDMTIVIVNDSTAPNIIDFTDNFAFLTSNTITGDCMSKVIVPASSIDVADNCDDASLITFDYVILDNVNFPVVIGSGDVDTSLATGVYTLRYYVADSKLNVDSVDITIEVQDDEAPVIVASVNDTTLQVDNMASCFATYTPVIPGTYENCAGLTVNWSIQKGLSNFLSGTSNSIPTTPFTVGNYTVVYTVTDAAGLSASDTHLINVVDTINPWFTQAVDTITVNAASNACEATISTVVKFADNCKVASIQSNPAGLTIDLVNDSAQFDGTFSVGVNTIYFTITDSSNNSTIDSIKVVVNDITFPTLNNFANIVAPRDANCAFVRQFIVASDFNPADNCPASELTTIVEFDLDNDGQYDDETVTLPIFDYEFVSDTTGVRVTTSDNSGNSVFDLFKVILNDQTAPTVFHQDTIFNYAGASCLAVTDTIYLDSALISDNCTTDKMDLLMNTTSSTTVPFTTFGIGDTLVADFPVGAVTPVTFTVTDLAGNVTQKIVYVSVIDITAPDAVPTFYDTIFTEPGLCQSDYTAFAPASTDNCGISATSYSVNDSVAKPYSGSFINTTLPKGVNKILWTTTDNSNNTVVDTSYITVLDNQAPVITYPGNITLTAGANCSFDTTFSAIALDNCDGSRNVTSLLITYGDVNDVDGDTISGGSSVQATFTSTTPPTTILFIASDASGNADTVGMVVNVSDNTAPVVTCPGAEYVVSAQDSVCGAYITLTPNFTHLFDSPIIENCGIDTIYAAYRPNNSMSWIPFAISTDQLNYFPVDTTTIHIWVRDNSGLTTECEFDLIVVDDQGPNVSNFPANVNINSLPNDCSRSVFWTEPTVNDNCSGNSVTVLRSHQSGYNFPVGVTTVTYTFIGTNQDTTKLSFTVTVNDVQNPSFTTPSNITLYLPSNACTVPVIYNVNAQDNCGGQGTNVTVNANIPSGSQLGQGEYDITVTVKDAANNDTTGTFHVSVIDSITPTLTVPSSFSTCNPVVTYNVSYSDNCAIQSAATAANTESGDTFPVGTTTVTWTVTDVNGKSVVKSFNVTVVAPNTTANAGQDQVICLGDAAILSGNTPNAGNNETALWSNPLAGINNPTSPTTTATFNTAGIYTFTYTINGNGVCAPSSDVMTVTVNNLPSAANAGADQVIAISETNLAATAPLSGIGTWTKDDIADESVILSPNVYNTTVTGLTNGAHTYVWTVASAGCAIANTDKVTITVNVPNTIVTGELPSAFTPNGDGVNDTWMLPGIENYPDAEVKIYNRQGAIVFEASGAAFAKTGWDGKFDGKDLPVASYYYVIDLKDESLSTRVRQGVVSVIR